MLVAVVIALTVSAIVLALFSSVASKRPNKVNLGERIFVMRQLERRTQQADVGPLFFNDLVKDNRALPLALAYLGGDRWAALNALPAGQPERCVVQWDQDRRVFVNPCNNEIFAPDGTREDRSIGLERFSAKADKDADRLVVDLNVAYADTLKSRPPA